MEELHILETTKEAFLPQPPQGRGSGNPSPALCSQVWVLGVALAPLCLLGPTDFPAALAGHLLRPSTGPSPRPLLSLQIFRT